MSTHSAKIILDQVSIAFGRRIVVQEVSVVLQEHDLLCIVGASGSGKTTLLRAVAGLLPLHCGRILLDDGLITRPTPRTAMIFQHFGLFPWKTVRANIAYGLSVQGRRDEDGTITRLLEVIVVLLFTIFPVLINTGRGVREVDPRLVEVAQAFCSNEYRLWIDLVLPSALPFVMTGIRLAIGRALMAVIVAEFYTAISGLGYLIVSNAHTFQTARVFVPVVVLMTLGVVTTGLLEVAEARIAPWRHTQT